MSKAPAGRGFPDIGAIRGNPIVGKKGQQLLPDLALDLSSSCVGWACGAHKKLERYGKFAFKTTAGTGEKLVSFEEYLEALITTFMPSRLLVEKPSTKGNTSIRHNELIGIVRKVWFEKTGLEIEDEWLIHPRTIKSLMKVPRGDNHDQNKVIMLNKINNLFSLNLKWDKNSKYKSDDDIADAIAVMEAFWRRSA